MKLENNRFAFWRQQQFFVWVSFLLVILVMIVIFPRQKFNDYTTTHSLTRYYKVEDYERSAALIEVIRTSDLVEMVIINNIDGCFFVGVESISYLDKYFMNIYKCEHFFIAKNH